MFTLRDLLPVAIILGVTIVGITVMANIVQNVYDDQFYGTNGTAANVSGEGLNALKEFGNWTPTIALVIAAALIIGVLISTFAFSNR